MKSLTSEERKNYILSCVKKHDFVDIGHLRENLGVSEMTVRRDLLKLENENLIVRVLGGARCIPKATQEDPVEKRVQFHSQEKDKVARYAASLIKDNDTVFMDSSSTIYAMVPYIEASVTVITNNISICTKLKNNNKVRVILLGGELRKSALSLVGMETLNMLENYYVDKAFLSSKAIDENYQIYDATLEEAEVKKKMMELSRETFFLMDHYKIKSKAFYKVGNLSMVDSLIVDLPEEKQVQEYLETCKKETGKIIVCR